MNFSPDVLDISEKIFLSLRSLYSNYGYLQYRMSKFEEYDLYSRNKDFLVSDSVITFTDTNGRLMALKPDVTLSIVKNVDDLPDTVQKLCYNESVYRVAKNNNTFREIMQTGLECIGRVDSVCISEALWLAGCSLQEISPDFMLDISQLDLLSAMVAEISSDSLVRQAILKCVGEKNLHGIDSICRDHGISQEAATPLKTLLATYGRPEKVLPVVRALAETMGLTQKVDELETAVSCFAGTELEPCVQIDFSVVCDPNYYNGIVFKGFINGVPESVLSGGQYDRLMDKMNRSSRAIGFAVYMDALERMELTGEEYDVDVLLLYQDDTNPAALCSAVSELVAQGIRVQAARSVTPKLKYRRLAEFRNGGVVILENNA